MSTKALKDIGIDGLSKIPAIVKLCVEGGVDSDVATKFWTENKPEVAKGFKAVFFDFLVEGAKTESDLDEFLKGKSVNVVKNRANWVGMMTCANRIWEINSPEAEEVDAEGDDDDSEGE